MNKWNTIIFDMDGTLFDTESIGYKSWMAYSEHYNIPVCDELIYQVLGRTRQSAMPLYEKYMPKGWDVDECYCFRNQFKYNYKVKHGPLPKTDLRKLLHQIKEKGYRVAICSSSQKKDILFNLSFDKLENEFDLIVDGSMVSNGKPAPDIYLHAAKMLGVHPNECLVIEDSRSGIHAAHSAEMDVIMVVDRIQPDKELEEKCMKIYYHLDDILEVM